MTYNFDRLIDRKSTSDIKWRTQGLRAFLPVDVSEDFIPMWIADMDFACPPCIVDAVTARAGQEIYGYCAPRDGYVEALKWWYGTRFGLELKREWLSVLPTVVAAINMGIRAFTQPGDQVIIQQPVYDPFASLVAKTGRELVNNALLFRDGDYYMDFDLLEKQAADPRAKVLILCSPHNPVGRVWTKEELARLGEICKRHQVLVISDEIHSDIVFSGHSHTPFPLASDAPCILCTAPGKTFNVAGLRASNIFIFDPELKKQYDTTCAAHSMPGSSTFGLAAVEAAYSPAGAEWLAQLLAYLEENARLVDRWAKEHHLGFTMPQGCFLCWLDLSPAGLTDQEIQTKIIVGQEVVCVPGPWFGPGGEGHLRLNIGCPRSILEEALRRIASVL
ncbi:MAG: pyridoxal phosphate-dependent aminotransferase [Angelakisella sp.]|jgi:cystathionine beta-lyase|nr:pyridoxal phosphate-dependent aminotransferase [Angelakisella sp.]